MQSVPITTNIVSTSPTQVRFTRQIQYFLSYDSTPVSSTNKTDGHDITEILLKVSLNTINLNKLIKVCILYISYESLTKSTIHQLSGHLKLEAQWAQPVSLIFHSALRKLNTQPCRCFLPSFGSFGQAVSEENIFQISTNQKEKLPVVAMFVNRSRRNEHSSQRKFHRCFLFLTCFG